MEQAENKSSLPHEYYMVEILTIPLPGESVHGKHGGATKDPIRMVAEIITGWPMKEIPFKITIYPVMNVREEKVSLKPIINQQWKEN